MLPAALYLSSRALRSHVIRLNCAVGSSQVSALVTMYSHEEDIDSAIDVLKQAIEHYQSEQVCVRFTGPMSHLLLDVVLIIKGHFQKIKATEEICFMLHKRLPRNRTFTSELLL